MNEISLFIFGISMLVFWAIVTKYSNSILEELQKI